MKGREGEDRKSDNAKTGRLQLARVSRRRRSSENTIPLEKKTVPGEQPQPSATIWGKSAKHTAKDRGLPNFSTRDENPITEKGSYAEGEKKAKAGTQEGENVDEKG